MRKVGSGTSIISVGRVFGLALLVAGLAACGSGRPSPLRVVNPTCDNLNEATGASVDRPIFGWELESAERGEIQSASQIRIATSPDILGTDRPNVWDSGKRRGRSSAFVSYGGKRLEAGRGYFWNVRVWDGKGRASAWSLPARFVTELVSPEDWSGARWIAFEELPDALKVVPGVHGNGDELGEKGLRRPVVPLFRKEFDVGPEGVKNALVFVSGLGQFELRVNGRKVGDGFLQPGWTDYRKTCLYDTFDVTGLLKPGRNVIGLVVGNGFFNVDRERYRKLVIAYGMPMMIAKVDIESASGRRSAVVSGPDWKTAPSPITFTSIYGGEDYDARLEQPGWDAPGFDDSAWRPALAGAAPEGRLSPERDVPLRVMEEIPFRAVAEPRPGLFVYDFGQNASGIIALKVRGRKGQTVSIAPAELLDAKGLADQSMSGSPYRWTYTLKGGGAEEWTPRFTYYGFRYAQASGLPEITGLRMLHTRNSAPTAGRFLCSKDLFNRTFTLIDWAIRSNLASVPTDCPHREKLGWLEQTHLMAGSIHYNYRVLTLYQKLVRDMIEAQLADGLVPDIAPEYVPFVGGFRDSPEWGSAAVILPWFLHEWYGDSGTMAAAYPMMKRYVDYLASKAKDHILSHGLGDWYDLGPKPPGEAQLTPRALTATAISHRDLDLLARMARLLGKDADAKDLAARAETVKKAFNGKFFDPAAKVYATGSQTSYAMPLHFGMVPPSDRRAVFANLVRSIREGGGALTAGDVGYDYLLKALEEGGASDLIYAMNDRSDVPGYGYQLAHGATALTESWAARRDVSNNHMMLGHLMEWFYSGLAGIRQAEGSTAFEALEIAPHPVGDVTWVRAEYLSIKGRIVSSWRLDAGHFRLDVEVPPNATATILMPFPGPSGGSGDPDGITESGLPLKRAKGVKFLGFRDGRAVLEIGSGAYHFAVPAPTP